MLLKNVFLSESYKDFVKKINYIPKKCKNCKIFNICHNGCPATRVNIHDELTHEGIYVYCEQRKHLFKEIEKILKNEGGGNNV